MTSVLTRIKQELWRVKSLIELKRSAAQRPEIAPPRTDAHRMLIGATNSAGQGYQWARALERVRPEIQVTSMQFVRDASMRFPIDLAVVNGYAAYSRSWQKRQSNILREYDAVLIESARPVLGGHLAGDTLRQIRELEASGVRVALVFHGSDIRDPETHMRHEPMSYFGIDDAFTDTIAEGVRTSQALIKAADVPVFVSTLDLLTDAPEARWLPVVIDIEKWKTLESPLSKPGPPLVVHVPSSSLIKGTDLVDPLMQQLHEDGVIVYKRVTGVAPHDMPGIYRSADIVLDQFRGGPYGVAACEAMAAGRIVISHVPHRDRVREHTGEDLPIIQATHENLAAVLQRIIEDPREALRHAGEGPAYVARHHDGTKSGTILSEWLA